MSGLIALVLWIVAGLVFIAQPGQGSKSLGGFILTTSLAPIIIWTLKLVLDLIYPV